MLLYIRKLPPESAWGDALRRLFGDRFTSKSRPSLARPMSEEIPAWRRHVAELAHLDPSLKLPDVVVSEATLLGAVT